MAWSTDNPRPLLKLLDEIERIVVLAGQLLMLVIIAAVLVFTGWVIVRRPWGAGNQGEWFYFTVAVLLVLGWAVGQFLSLGRRLNRHDQFFAFDSSNQSDQQGAPTWRLQLSSGSEAASESTAGRGEGLAFSFSRSFELPLASLLREMMPDEEALCRLEAETAGGATIEEACRAVQPAFDGWSGMQQRAYRLLVTRLMEERQSANAGV